MHLFGDQKMASNFSPGPPVASLPTTRHEEILKREVAVCVERIRSGLFCVHNQWDKPQCKTRSAEELFPNDDSTAGIKQSDEMPLCTPVITTSQPQLPTFEGKPLDSTSSTGLFAQPQKEVVWSALPVAGFTHKKINKPTFGKSASPPFRFGLSHQNFAFQSVGPISSAGENCPNGTADKIFGTHHQQVVYVADFAIDGKSYTLKASFAKSTMKIVGSLELTQIKTKSIGATEEKISDGARDESKTISNGTTEEDLNDQQPSAVWANLNGTTTKILPLKKSLNSAHQWMSENFDGSFAYSERLFSVDEWKPWKSLACFLWIEFETFTGGEKRVLKQLAAMYVQQNHCDVQFTFKGDQHIGGHVNILVARSSVFAAMFEHDMKEAATGEVAIEDVQPEIFKELLHYIYSGRLLTPLTETTAQPLFVAADKYDINDLKEECVIFLLTCVRVDNVINLLVWAHLHSVDELHQVTLSFMTLHGKEVCHLKEWEDLTKNYPELCMLATRRIIDRLSL